MTDDQDEDELRDLTRAMFGRDDPQTTDTTETPPLDGNQVPVEGGNPAPTRVDDLREFARQLFAPDQP